MGANGSRRCVNVGDRSIERRASTGSLPIAQRQPECAVRNRPPITPAAWRRISSRARTCGRAGPATASPSRAGGRERARWSGNRRRRMLGDVGVVARRGIDECQDFLGERRDLCVIAALARLVGLALDVVVDLGGRGIRVSDALVALARDAFRDRGVDADLGPVGTTPTGIGGRLGSSGFARALLTIMMSRSPCTRVAIAHSTSAGSKMSMSSSTTTTCLRSITDSAASSAFLPSPDAS